MENLQAKLLSTALGASSSMAGLLALSKCSGSTCASCFGCAGTGIGVLLFVLFSKIRRNGKEKNYGMAQRRG